MHWYILSIIIYGPHNEKRVVSFKPGVNIVLGDVKTGKTSLIYIVDYCLGSSECAIPDQAIRKFAQWYAVLIQAEEEQLFLARKNSATGKSDVMYLLARKSITIPNTIEELHVKTDRNAVVKDLSQRLGMMERSLAESSYDKGYAQSPTIRNVAPFLFQPGHIIANKDTLFYRMNEEEYQRRLRRIFPWLLGSVNQEYLDLKGQLEEEQRRLRQLERRSEEQERLRDDTLMQGSSLWRQAQMLGLAGKDAENGSSKQPLRKVLERILKKHVNDVQPEDPVSSIDPQRAMILTKKSDELRAEIVRYRHQLAEAEALVAETTQMTHTLEHQTRRLQVIDILPQREPDVVVCPLCHQQIGTFAPLIERLYQIRDNLREELSTMQRVSPRLDTHIRELRDKVDVNQKDLSRVEADLREIYRFQDVSSTRHAWAERQRILGAIRFYLEQNPTSDVDFSTLERDILDARRVCEAIKKRLEEFEEDNPLELANAEISREMITLSRLFPVEEQGATLSLDLKKLTLSRQSRTGRPVWLNHIGSDENAIGYHLCVLLALHTFFIHHRRPVPSFLFLDQLSQPYFSLSTQKDEQMQDNLDEKALFQFYDGIVNVAEGLKNQLQIIILDHPSLPERFRSFIRQEWRNGKKLV